VYGGVLGIRVYRGEQKSNKLTHLFDPLFLEGVLGFRVTVVFPSLTLRCCWGKMLLAGNIIIIIIFTHIHLGIKKERLEAQRLCSLLTVVCAVGRGLRCLAFCAALRSWARFDIKVYAT
jgi:hypothetical protein